MTASIPALARLLFCVTVVAALPAAASSFICQEPGGKRLIEIDGNDISRVDGKIALRIDGDDITASGEDKKLFVVDDSDVRHSAAGVKIATFDGKNIRHGPYPDGKVMINYQHPDLCPTASANRIYSIEGDPLSHQQLVAGLYLLKPDMFTLSTEEVGEQQKAIKEAGEEQDKKDAADQVAGKWTLLNSSGISDKVGKGTITVAEKKGAAYPVTFDFTDAGGPTWTGAGFYEVVNGDKLFYAAYGTPKTIALCVYEIAGGTLNGTWYPYYVDGTDKTVGTETLKGPETLDGTYTIESAKAPFTGAAYSGTVEIKPLAIVGADDDAKPYSITWTIGTAKLSGIGIRSGNHFFVATGTGADVNIARFKLGNGAMNSNWFKLGSTEQGSSAAMNQ